MKLKTSLPYVLVLLAGLILAVGNGAFAASSGNSSLDKSESTTGKTTRKKTSSRKTSTVKDGSSSGKSESKKAEASRKTTSSKSKRAKKTGKASTAAKASPSTKEAVAAKDQGKAAAKAADAKSVAQSGKKVVLKDLQVYNGRDYSRIVLVLSGQTDRHWQLLPADASPDGVRRLYVDLDNVIIRKGVSGRFDVHGDAARKVRLSYFKPDVARTVIEVENLKSYNVFELENPCRVVVDVQAEASAKKAGSASGAKGSEKAGKAKSAGKSVGKAAGALAGSSDDDKPGDKPGLPGVNLSTPAHRKMAKQLVEQLGLTVRTVMVDAGHGGKDPGARGVGGLREKDVTLRVAKLLGARLSRMGFNVLYTRTTDKFVPLEVRTAMANANKADLFLSVHCNAHGDPNSTGLETYSLNLASTANDVRVAARENSVDPGRISDMQKILDDLMHASKLSESCDFAKAVHASTLAEERKCLDQKDRGVNQAPFYVLLGARMPAVLVEVGYITNPKEAAKLRDEKYLESLAKGIAGGVEDYKNRIERYARK